MPRLSGRAVIRERMLRIQAGGPSRLPAASHPPTHEFAGKLRTLKEVARLTGKSYYQLQYQVQDKGIPLLNALRRSVGIPQEPEEPKPQLRMHNLLAEMRLKKAGQYR